MGKKSRRKPTKKDHQEGRNAGVPKNQIKREQAELHNKRYEQEKERQEARRVNLTNRRGGSNPSVALSSAIMSAYLGGKLR